MRTLKSIALEMPPTNAQLPAAMVSMSWLSGASTTTNGASACAGATWPAPPAVAVEQGTVTVPTAEPHTYHCGPRKGQLQALHGQRKEGFAERRQDQVITVDLFTAGYLTKRGPFPSNHGKRKGTDDGCRRCQGALTVAPEGVKSALTGRWDPMALVQASSSACSAALP